VEAHMMPSTHESWEEHTKSGYYIGVSEEHYRCHKIYISSTRSIRVCQTVYFKHKYLTQPSFTINDALILAADNLATAIDGAMPNVTATQSGIRQLLDIFKKQANTGINRDDFAKNPIKTEGKGYPERDPRQAAFKMNS
jgi:hypothetical protein